MSGVMPLCRAPTTTSWPRSLRRRPSSNMRYDLPTREAYPRKTLRRPRLSRRSSACTFRSSSSGFGRTLSTLGISPQDNPAGSDLARITSEELLLDGNGAIQGEIQFQNAYKRLARAISAKPILRSHSGGLRSAAYRSACRAKMPAKSNEQKIVAANREARLAPHRFTSRKRQLVPELCRSLLELQQ